MKLNFAFFGVLSLLFISTLLVKGDRTIYISEEGENQKYFVINGAINPTLYLMRGEIYNLKITAPSLPFTIKTTPRIDANLYYAGMTDLNSKSLETLSVTDGVLTWIVPKNAPGKLYYGSTDKKSVVNEIIIRDTAPNLGIWYGRRLILPDGKVDHQMEELQKLSTMTFDITNTGDDDLIISSIILVNHMLEKKKHPLVASPQTKVLCPHCVTTVTITYNWPFFGHLSVISNDAQVMYKVELAVTSPDNSTLVTLVESTEIDPLFNSLPQDPLIDDQDSDPSNSSAGALGSTQQGKAHFTGKSFGSEEGVTSGAHDDSLVAYIAIPIACVGLIAISILITLVIVRKKYGHLSLNFFSSEKPDLSTPQKPSHLSKGKGSSSDMEIIAINSSDEEDEESDRDDSTEPNTPVSPKFTKHFSRRF